MKKVIVTGASGFIGGTLAKKLLSRGVKVYGVGQNQEKLNSLKQYGDFIPVTTCFEQYNSLHDLINDRDFDMFWHFAWQGTSAGTDSYKDYSVQVKNIKAACDAAASAVKLNCARGCFVSSHYQFFRGIDENIHFNPVLYGNAKKSAADLFKCILYNNNVSCANIIFPNIIGVGDKRDTAVVFFIKRFLADEPINLVSGKYREDWIYIDTLIDGVISAAKTEKKYTDYFIGHRNITTFKEKLTAMKSLLNSKSELKFGSYPEKCYVDYDQCDLNALHRDTGFEAKDDFAENIRKITEWISNTGE